MDRPSPEIVSCSYCGARNFGIDDHCSACGRRFSLLSGPRAKVRRVGYDPRAKVRRVSYGSAMAVIAVVAICLAPIRDAPGLCILLAIVLVPATARAILHIEGRKAEGRPMIVYEKVGAYVYSATITIVILAAASTAFVATCFPTGYCILAISGENQFGLGLIVACIAGAVSALFVIYKLGRRLWPRKD
jgi:hypothetical protein